MKFPYGICHVCGISMMVQPSTNLRNHLHFGADIAAVEAIYHSVSARMRVFLLVGGYFDQQLASPNFQSATEVNKTGPRDHLT
ncbi:hypothetical protein TNCV_1912511 [Trichonephila clavipes]|nr:hypothetical protein TNCV_1912511 [Trichonephila clavipes]